MCCLKSHYRINAVVKRATTGVHMDTANKVRRNVFINLNLNKGHKSHEVNHHVFE